MGSFWAKYIFFELKKNRGIIFHETDEGCKIWGGINSLFQNWHKEFDKIWTEHSKVSKILILMGSFWAKYIFFELKRNRGIIFHETEQGCKICREIDSLFQKWHKEFDKIWPEHSKVSKILILVGPFWAKYILFEPKKSTQELSFMTLESDARFEAKTDLLLRKWRGILAIFTKALESVKTGTLIRSFCPKLKMHEL